MRLLVTRRSEGERIELPGVGVNLRVLVPAAATAGRLCMLEEVTPAGAGPPMHRHLGQTEILRFLEGRYEVEVDGHRFAVSPGDLVVVPPGARHAFRNVGGTVARLSLTLTPAGSGEQFFRELAGHMASGAGDLRTLQALAGRHDMEIVGPPLEAAGRHD